MTFLAALISLLIERFFHWSHLRQWSWFFNYQKWLDAKVGQLSPVLLLTSYIAPLVIIVGLISYLLHGHWYNFVYLAFGVLVLLYCLGPGNLWAQAYQCLSELNKDDPKHAPEFAQQAFGIPLPANSTAFHQAFMRALFVAANERIFAVVFWFAVLGPMGAVLYRLIELCTDTQQVSMVAVKMQKVLDWLPVRLFTFIFALTGNFSKVIASWKNSVKKGIDANETVIVDGGMAALDMASDNRVREDGSAEKEALLLFDRTLILALTILAVVVLLV